MASGQIIVTLFLFFNSWAAEVVDKQQSEHCSSISNSKPDSGCGTGSDNDSSKQRTVHRYSRGANENWNTFLGHIEKAELEYAKRELEISNLKKGDCSLYEAQIDRDLLPFKSGITIDKIDSGRERGTLYQVIAGKLYRDKSCKFPARCTGIEYFLKNIAKDLPDLEFIVNTSDWPQTSIYSPDPLPVFSFSKTKDYSDILYPAWTFWAGGPAIPIYPMGIGRWDLMRTSLISVARKLKWNTREPIALFRGSRTSSERDPLVYLSRKRPDLVDAQYTKNQAWKSDADTLNAPAATEIKFEDHCGYKFLFNYRGVAASFRFKHLFLCKSLVFHVGDEWIEFFYPELKPWVHYIPISYSAKEDYLGSIIEFAKEYDDIAERIAERGFKFIKRHLKMDHVSCYWNSLLNKYSKLLKYSVKRRKEMIAI